MLLITPMLLFSMWLQNTDLIHSEYSICINVEINACCAPRPEKIYADS